MEFNTFNTFDIVGNESCQPNYLISMTLEDSHIMRLEGDFLESSDQTSSSEEKKYKTLSPEQREDIVKGLKSEGIIGSELTLPQQGMWRKFVSCLENKQKNEKNAAKELKIESEIWKTMLRNVIPRFVIFIFMDSSFLTLVNRFLNLTLLIQKRWLACGEK